PPGALWDGLHARRRLGEPVWARHTPRLRPNRLHQRALLGRPGAGPRCRGHHQREAARLPGPVVALADADGDRTHLREGGVVVTGGGGTDLLEPTVLARLATDAGRRAARDVRDLAPIAFRLEDGRVCRFVPDGAHIDVDAVDQASTVVELALT